MKIGLWSDAVNFPNVPLMKLSTHHKQLGDVVEFAEENGKYDKVYLSKTFNLPMLKKIPQYPPQYYADETVKGGTGYAISVENGKEVFNESTHINLPLEIETLCPDYTLYPQYSEAYGFLTRGCCNNCSFCLVTQKEGACSKRVAELSDFHRGQREIKLLDPNLLACADRENLLQELIDSKCRIDFTQGLDARFITDDVAKMVNDVKIKMIHFAFDFMKNEKQIIQGLSCFRRHYTGSFRNLKCYVLTNYDTTLEEDWYRVKKLLDLGYTPYVMIYQKGTHPQFLTDLARWSNSMYLTRSCSFEEYAPRVDGKSCKELYPKILKTERNFIMATTKKTASKNKY